MGANHSALAPVTTARRTMQRRYHDGTYARDNPGWHADDAPHKARVVASLLEDLAWSPRRVLDVGTGSGDVLRHLQELRDARGQEATYLGWDPAEIPGQVAPGPRLTFTRDAPHAAAADVALCLDVFEHVVDDLAFLQSLHPLASRWIFRIPLDLSVLDVLRPRRMLEARRRYGHLHLYTQATALALLEEAGFLTLLHRHDHMPLSGPPRVGHLTDLVRRGVFRVAPGWCVDVLGGFSLLVAARSRG